jgi:hypothetical protein
MVVHHAEGDISDSRIAQVVPISRARSLAVRKSAILHSASVERLWIVRGGLSLDKEPNTSRRFMVWLGSEAEVWKMVHHYGRLTPL